MLFPALLENIAFSNLEKQIERESYQRLAISLLFIVDKILLSPEEYPFTLSQVEFETYSTKIFGGEIQNIKSTYRPPSYYLDAAKLATAAAASAAIGMLATAALPEALAVSAVMFRFAPAMAKGAGAYIGNKIAGSILPVDIISDHKERKLWPIYNIDLDRRNLH